MKASDNGEVTGFTFQLKLLLLFIHSFFFHSSGSGQYKKMVKFGHHYIFSLHPKWRKELNKTIKNVSNNHFTRHCISNYIFMLWQMKNGKVEKTKSSKITYSVANVRCTMRNIFQFVLFPFSWKEVRIKPFSIHSFPLCWYAIGTWKFCRNFLFSI